MEKIQTPFGPMTQEEYAVYQARNKERYKREAEDRERLRAEGFIPWTEEQHEASHRRDARSDGGSMSHPWGAGRMAGGEMLPNGPRR